MSDETWLGLRAMFQRIPQILSAADHLRVDRGEWSDFFFLIGDRCATSPSTFVLPCMSSIIAFLGEIVTSGACNVVVTDRFPLSSLEVHLKFT